MWEVLRGHPLNKWAWPAGCWPLNPGTAHLLVSQRKVFCNLLLLLQQTDASGKRGMNSSGKPAQTKTQLTWVWKEGKYCVSGHCFFLLPRMLLSLNQLSYNDLVLVHQGWDVSGIFLLFLCPNRLSPAVLDWAALSTSRWGVMPNIQGDAREHVLEEPELSRVFQFPRNSIWDHISTPNSAWNSMLKVHIRPNHLHTLPGLLDISFHCPSFKEESLMWRHIHHDLMT